MRTIFNGLTLFLFVLSLASRAEEANNLVRQFGDWTVRCESPNRKGCTAVIGAKDAEHSGIWVKMGLYISPASNGQDETHLIVRTPSVTSESKSTPLNIDRRQLGILFPECQENYCETDVLLTKTDIEQIKTGQHFAVGFRLPPRQEGLVLFVPLSGAYEALQYLTE